MVGGHLPLGRDREVRDRDQLQDRARRRLVPLRRAGRPEGLLL
jgi:hypothetical protein